MKSRRLLLLYYQTRRATKPAICFIRGKILECTHKREIITCGRYLYANLLHTTKPLSFFLYILWSDTLFILPLLFLCFSISMYFFTPSSLFSAFCNLKKYKRSSFFLFLAEFARIVEKIGEISSKNGWSKKRIIDFYISPLKKNAPISNLNQKPLYRI